jgi:hypothetical protein
MKKKEIRHKYYDYVISKKKAPKNLNKFLPYAELKKKDFKAKYETLSDVEADIWKNSLKEALNSLQDSTEFASYTCKDKGLAMMYTWFEFMDLNKSFFKKCHFMQGPMPLCHFMKFKKETKKFIKGIIKHGFTSAEFKDRSIPPKYFADLFWSLFIVNVKSWKKKKGEEWMDAMVEKSMVFFFDSLAPNLFDTFFDMLKHSRSKK